MDRSQKYLTNAAIGFIFPFHKEHTPMALDKIKTESSGGRGQARKTRRADAKAGSRKRRRRADRVAVARG